jgi:uncharacterized protein
VEIKNNVYYKKFLKDPWPYITGAVILGLINIGMLAAAGTAWGVTTPFAYWGAWIYKAIGGHPESWFFFQQKANQTAFNGGFMNNAMSLSNVGIIAGAFLSTLLASQFKIKKIKSWKQVVAAILGGLLMGYGARIAFGCNIGALFSGVASMSLHGWVYWVSIFIGAWIGSKLLVKYFM